MRRTASTFLIAEKVKRQKLREKFTRDTKEESFIVRLLEGLSEINWQYVLTLAR